MSRCNHGDEYDFLKQNKTNKKTRDNARLRCFYPSLSSSQREAVGVIDRVITANGKPYHYLLKNLNDRPIRYKFSAADLKPAPALEDIKLTVNQILETRAGKCKVSFYGYPR